MVWTVLDFAREGRGTPSPWVPTQELVVTGPYRYSRNPMYIGALLVLLGQRLWTRMWQLLLYASGVATLFHSVVVLYEEPHLRQQFGAPYEHYQRTVPRRLPGTGNQPSW